LIIGNNVAAVITEDTNTRVRRTQVDTNTEIRHFGGVMEDNESGYWRTTKKDIVEIKKGSDEEGVQRLEKS
jgi:hypothetical protein